MTFPSWEVFERYVAQVFGLDTTIASGNKFFDPGDAVNRDRDHPFPLFVDAKYTEAASYPLKMRELANYTERAADVGKRLVVALRFWPRGRREPEDYAIVGLHDLVELLGLCAERKVSAVPRRRLLDDEELGLLEGCVPMFAAGVGRTRLQELIVKLEATEVT
jgi:hypothetical protein